ncbi:hypothetical protein C8R46DRAFT_1362530 [Mycena filopes]|nr:hypothetical protein C8R46DRAFT_1362530 [Mycena filopes]
MPHTPLMNAAYGNSRVFPLRHPLASPINTIDVNRDSESESDDGVSPENSPTTPESPCRRPWHRRLEIVIPRKANLPTSSPRSPLSPVKLWSAVQRGASAMPVLRLKPKHKRGPDMALPTEDDEPVRETICAVAFAPSILPQEVDSDPDSDSETYTLYDSPYDNLPPPYDTRPSWWIPAHSPPPPPPIVAPVQPHRRPRLRPLEDPASYRWLPPPPPTPPASLIDSLTDSDKVDECADLRWYHPLLLVLLWHLCIVVFSTYVVLRVLYKPLLAVMILGVVVQLAVIILL